MNAWTRDVVAYLKERDRAGDRRACGLLLRSPRAAPEKRPIVSIVHLETRRRRKESAEAQALEDMHDQVWAWNLVHTSVPGSAYYGRCDCGCGRPFRSYTHGECDHWVERSQGGADTRANGWRLLPECHEEKTNAKDRRPWNERRRLYCERAGISYVERRVRL